MEQVTITVQDKIKETIVSPKTGKNLDTLKLVSTDGDIFEGLQYQGDPAIGETIDIKFNPLNTQRGLIKSIVQLGNKATNAPTKRASMANKTVNAKRASEAAIGKVMNVDKTTKDLSQEVSGIIQALLGTGLYNSVSDTDRGRFVNINKIALETHTRDVLEIKAKIMKDNS